MLKQVIASGVLLALSFQSWAEENTCQYAGITLHGKVKKVDSFPDIKIQVVTSFPDLRVQVVQSFPDNCGQWQWVDSFPDFTVQFVDSFPQLKIQYVDAFSGKP
ncbi:hypothetical protein BegalDRAFT_2921 [Beggiatoa alba B18LD]|uniref:7(1) septoil knot domain-containing protein n=1 Tax=Beggiatoa alba B18LD TaxID=395493 RepID=I3CJF6_9GAMM|nr:hypothetical protein [Beggiatoa alba]EIJ43749.1 hypothetical protein BegalDRAFT_2921 [Beggiatoa alba B18LD]